MSETRPHCLCKDHPAVSAASPAGAGVRFRIATLADAEALASLHHLCSREQPDGFLHLLGRPFLAAYYRILLRNPSTLVVCADSGEDGLVGLVSACLEVGEELEALRRGRYRLLLAALPAILRHPSLIAAVRLRMVSLRPGNAGEGFVVGHGPRLSFWGWSPCYPSAGLSTQLFLEMLRKLKERSVSVVSLEVDRSNRKVELIHRYMGARLVQEFVTKDGRKRLVMEHHL